MRSGAGLTGNLRVPLKRLSPGKLTFNGTTGSAAAFTPDQLSGLIGWWKADALALSDGTAVATWTASAGPNLTQATGANQPIFKTAILNGLPVVRFALANFQSMAAGSAITNLATVFAVAKYNSATFGGFFGCFSGSLGQNDNIIFTGDGGNTDWFSGAWTGASYWKNGTLDSTNQGPMAAFAYMSLITSGFNSSITPMVGIDRGIGGRNWDGDIAEIVAYNSALSTGNRQQVEQYLKSKWGL